MKGWSYNEALVVGVLLELRGRIFDAQMIPIGRDRRTEDAYQS